MAMLQARLLVCGTTRDPLLGAETGLYPMTGYAGEGNVVVSSWWNNQRVQMKLEQSALFDGNTVLYLAERQKALHVVGFSRLNTRALPDIRMISVYAN